MKPETSNFTREVLPRSARRTLFPSPWKPGCSRTATCARSAPRQRRTEIKCGAHRHCNLIQQGLLLSCIEVFFVPTGVLPLGSQAYWIALNQNPYWHVQGILLGEARLGFPPLRNTLRICDLLAVRRSCSCAASVTRSIKAQRKALLQMHEDRHKGSGKVSRWVLQSGRWDAAAAAPSVLPWPAMAVSVGNSGYDGRSRAEIETENKN